MLIRNLYNPFCCSESQDGRLNCVFLNVIDKSTQVIIPEKFKEDIERLEKYGVELRNGLCIELELSELLEILPRERRRKNVDNKLAKCLADKMDIKLVIINRSSNK